jgi:acetyl-CoA C-acetyltransferase
VIMATYVLGGYQTDFARNWTREGKHIAAMIQEVVAGALERTRLEARHIQVGHLGNFAAELYANQGHLGAFLVEVDPAFRGLPTSRHEAACASGALAVLAAAADLAAGHYQCALVVGVEQMKSVDAARGANFLGTAAWQELEARGVEFPFPRLFGRLGDEYERRYGLDDRHLARIAALNYQNARRNPRAQTRAWFMNETHARSTGQFNTAIGGRIKASDCSQITDGAAALVLASPEFAREYASERGLSIEQLPTIMGWGHTTAPLLFDDKLRESAAQPYVLPHTRRAILAAFQRAGLTDCWQLDAVETHDCFTTSEYMAIDHFGLTAPGQSWRAIEDGVIEPRGRLPFNPSGGLIGCGHPVGATGVRQVLDAYLQVTGNAGDCQVEGARRVGTLNLGGSATSSIALVVGTS